MGKIGTFALAILLWGAVLAASYIAYFCPPEKQVSFFFAAMVFSGGSLGCGFFLLAARTFFKDTGKPTRDVGYQKTPPPAPPKKS